MLNHNLMQLILLTLMACHFGGTICTFSSCLFQPLEGLIGSAFIPKVLGREIPGKVECDLFSLPGGLGLFNPTVTAVRQHACSQHTGSPLVDLIVSQIHDASFCRFSYVLKYLPPNINNYRNVPIVFMISFLLNFSPQLNFPVKNASNWLSCFPLRSHGFALHKSAFRDGLLLCYHWTSLVCPTSCACGHEFTIDHCISCPKGGFPSLRHNKLCDLTVKMMSEVCNNVSMNLIFSHFLVKLFTLRQLTQTLMLGLILLPMASGEDDLSVLFLMLEFSTLVHHLIIPLSLLIITMRGRRDVSMSRMFVRLNTAILHR